MNPQLSRLFSRRFLGGLFCAIAMAIPALQAKEAGQGWSVRHEPKQPHSGEAVTVTAETDVSSPAGPPVLEYQVVEPGHYIAPTSPAYEQGWQRLSPNDSTSVGKFRFQVPAEVQRHRRLVRYRLVDAATHQRLFPGTNDTAANAAWFAYDGVPAWKGAIDPKAWGMERKPITISAEAMRRVQAYQLISDRKSVEDSTWFRPTSFGSDDAKEYRWTGTLVSDDGTVYEGVRFRPRGGAWRHAMGKNMWKFDFLSGHKLQARDDHGRPYQAKWSKLNLGACFQQGDIGLRGEQGMLESVTFRLFNLVGLPAPATHWVQLRVIDNAEETPADQYEGDFWGLYLATENVDANFLREHDLSPQSLFKVEEFRPRFGLDAKDGVGEPEAQGFMGGLFQKRPDEAWWRRTVDLPQYYGYRAIIEAVHHYDIGGGKNYFFRHDPDSGRWTVVPWDTDLSWQDHVYGDGNEPFLQAGALRIPALKREYQNRLREVLDLLYNADQTGALIDEYAAVISDPAGAPGITEADRRHWDHHPILSSRHAQSFKSAPGTYYQKSTSGDFPGMIDLMKRFVVHRGQLVEQRLLTGQPVPPRPVIAADGPIKPGSGKLRFHVQPDSLGEGKPAIAWRLGVVTATNAPGFDPRSARQYEILPLWSVVGDLTAEIPSEKLRPGTTYRVRARLTDAQGNAGHWSDPVEFTYDK